MVHIYGHPKEKTEIPSITVMQYSNVEGRSSFSDAVKLLVEKLTPQDQTVMGFHTVIGRHFAAPKNQNSYSGTKTTQHFEY